MKIKKVLFHVLTFITVLGVTSEAVAVPATTSTVISSNINNNTLGTFYWRYEPTFGSSTAIPSHGKLQQNQNVDVKLSFSDSAASGKFSFINSITRVTIGYVNANVNGCQSTNSNNIGIYPNTCDMLIQTTN